MRIVRPVLTAAGVLLLAYLVIRTGTEPILETLSRLTWWQFGLVCLPYGLITVVDTLGWRYAFARNGAPFRALLGARIAGDAVNLVTALASVGGEAVKAWLIHRHVSYDESVPSLIIAKTTSTVAQGLFLIVGLAVAHLAVDLEPGLSRTMHWLLLVECVAIGGFVLVQLTGVIARAGRIAGLLGASGGRAHAEQLDASLRSFYREQWPRFLVSTALNLAGWILGGFEAFVMLYALDVPLSLATAVVVEAFGAAVRFAAFLVPAGIGVSEAANAGAFASLGAGAGAGLAFSFVRRARQAVWIGIGLLLLVAMRSGARMPGAPDETP